MCSFLNSTKSVMGEQATVTRQYQLRFEGREHYRARVWQILCSRFFSRYIPSDASVLDLGAGWGEFINQIGARRKLAMDLNPETGARVGPDVEFLAQDCSRPWPLESESLDVVFTSNFLEHLPGKSEVERTVHEAARCLRPGGRLICLGPNIRYVGGAYWDFWDHHVPLSDASLAELLRLAGLSIERGLPRFLPYTMSRGWVPPSSLVRLYLALPLLWPLFGKQFLVIGRKPVPADG